MKRTEQGYRVGEDHQKAKLTNEQVEQMRAEHETKGSSYGQLAKAFKCGVSTARDIVQYRTRTYG
jgi:Mor family transcriptional regulator